MLVNRTQWPVNRKPLRLPSRRDVTGARFGFTLIEVLVVVAIIALLVAILLPSLARARALAKSTACRANQHDLGNTFNLYAETYQGYYPITSGAGSDSFYAAWKAKLIRNLDILICPSTRNVIRTETLNWPVTYATSPEGAKVPYMAHSSGRESDLDNAARNGRDDASGGHSYEYNAVYDTARTVGGKPISSYSEKHKRNKDFIFKPQEMMLVHDNDDAVDNQPNPALGCSGDDSLFKSGNNCPQPWDNHGSEGLNMMFADGHAIWNKRLSGTYQDVRDANPGPTITGRNASIDRVWLRSQYPWEFQSRR